jgi:hypothetical protein
MTVVVYLTGTSRSIDVRASGCANQTERSLTIQLMTQVFCWRVASESTFSTPERVRI